MCAQLLMSAHVHVHNRRQQITLSTHWYVKQHIKWQHKGCYQQDWHINDPQEVLDDSK